MPENAHLFGDRGVLADGNLAKFQVCDLEQLDRHPTLTEPFGNAVDKVYVMVDAEPVVDDAEYTGAPPGRSSHEFAHVSLQRN